MLKKKNCIEKMFLFSGLGGVLFLEFFVKGQL